MHKHRIVYDSPIDAIVALAKRLSVYEAHYNLSSEEFIDKFSQGEMTDSKDFIEWANDYQHFLSMKLELEKQLNHAA